jgi:hypothetical protein
MAKKKTKNEKVDVLDPNVKTSMDDIIKAMFNSPKPPKSEKRVKKS